MNIYDILKDSMDILEIKKADIKILTKYRNNHVATREVSDAIQ